MAQKKNLTYKKTELSLFGKPLYVAEVTTEELQQINEALISMAQIAKEVSTYAKMRNVLRK